VAWHHWYWGHKRDTCNPWQLQKLRLLLLLPAVLEACSSGRLLLLDLRIYLHWAASSNVCSWGR
jgi:hypothetical protein